MNYCPCSRCQMAATKIETKLAVDQTKSDGAQSPKKSESAKKKGKDKHLNACDLDDPSKLIGVAITCKHCLDVARNAVMGR